MNLDNLFEDLEAQFDGYVAASQQRGVLEVSHVMRVWHQGEQITELAAEEVRRYLAGEPPRNPC